MRRSHRLVLAAVTIAMGLSWTVATAASTSGLVERAERLRERRPATTQQSQELGRRLGAIADSLHAAGEVGLATRCLESAGILAARRNELVEAVRLWELGLDWAREAESRSARSSLLNALAIGHSMRGDVDAALPVYAESIELRASLADTVGLSRTWGNLANLYANTGRLAEALEATQEEARWLDLTDNATGRIAHALRRAQILISLGRPSEAEVWAERAMSLSADEPRSSAHGLALLRRGDVRLELGEFEAAQRSLADAARTLRAVGDRHSAAFAEQMRLIALHHLGRHEECLDGVGRMLEELEGGEQDPLRTVLLRLRGHALFALGRREEAERSIDRALELFEARRASLDDARSRAGIFLASGEIYAAAARCRLAAGDVEGAFDLVERGRAPLFRDRTGSGLVGRESLQRILEEQNAALVLFNDPRVDPLIAFVLHADGLEAVELGSIDPLAADARAAGRLLAAGEPLESVRPILDRLSRSLSEPVLARLPDGVERSYVVAPSSLLGFPFELLGDGRGRRWEERATLSLLPNASSLALLRERRASPEGFVALADPTLRPGVSATGPLPVSAARAAAGVPLPHARREARAVAPRGGQVLVGDRATAEILREGRGPEAAVLHLATHASVDPVDGSRSALLLAGPEGIDELRAPELLDLDLRHDLVVLSGCSTFGLDRSFGEGWFGLPRSFLSAGARSVVSTLWDVEDAGARRFVEAFYQGLRRGLPRDRALAAARERARQDGLPPREWAAFVLTGLGGEPVGALVSASGTAPAGSWKLLVLLLLLAARGLLPGRDAPERSS